MKAEEALQYLKEGNARFIAGKSTLHATLVEKRERLAIHGQNPHSLILCCSDSRVSPDIIFDQGHGELFVIRNAGNVTDTSVFGSVEFAVAKLDVQLLVVMGHTGCGAVTAAQQNTPLPKNARKLIEPILPLLKSSRELFPEIPDDQVIRLAIGANIEQSIDEIWNNSEIVQQKVETGELKIVSALYDMETGKVDWM